MLTHESEAKSLPPMADLLDGMLSEIVLDCADQQAEAREAWASVTAQVVTDSGIRALDQYEASLEGYVKKLVRSAYWRGYYTGSREAGRTRAGD